LLSWYDRNGRALPWRVRGGAPDPYRTWLSEVMLQQTTAAAVGPYYLRFLQAWPSVEALARAPREEVLAAWAGLGYYARARNLHAAAQLLAAHGFPETEAGWRALPGIGAYSAAAIAAIAYGEAANVVDGNVERVIARLCGVETPLPGAKPALRALAEQLATDHRPGDWAQALMDLGALVCTPRAPKCGECPWRRACAAYASGAPQELPRRAPKPTRPERYGAAFRIARDGRVWLVRRAETGLLGGMAGLPGGAWRDRPWARREALAFAPCAARWRKIGAVRHVFTHFALTLDVYAADATPPGEGWWGEARELPSVFRKAAALSEV
jgi:A/G-specific adenine glycosylase